MDHSTKYGRVGTVRLVFLTLLAIGALFAPGCTHSFFGSKVPVIWGQISRNGKPITDGVVMFTPEANGSDAGIAPVRSDGTYRLVENYRAMPLVSGWYRIAVLPNRHWVAKDSKSGSESTPTQADGSNARSAAQPASSDNPGVSSQGETSDASQDSRVEASEIPLVYHNPNTTRLRLWIRPQMQRVDINLLD